MAVPGVPVPGVVVSVSAPSLLVVCKTHPIARYLRRDRGHPQKVNTSTSTITSYLQDASVLEGSLRRTLIAHIAVSARDEHRSLLEDHLRVTIAQERRINERLTELGEGQNPVQAVIGAAKGAGALVLTLAKGPADALRGPTGDDVTLRNAQDECASEQLEIAVYTAIEALATELGDEQTAELARRHRAQEEDFLERLTATVPELARNVANNRKGNRTFGLPTIGAIDAARALVAGAQTALRPGGSDDGETNGKPTDGNGNGGGGGAAESSSARSGGIGSTPNAPGKAPSTSRTAGKFEIAAVPDGEKAAGKPRPTAPAKQAGAPTPPAARTGAAKPKPKPAPKPAAKAKKAAAVVPPSAKDIPEPEINKSKPKRATPAASASVAAKPKPKPAAAKSSKPAAKPTADARTPAARTTGTGDGPRTKEPKPAVTPTTPPIGQYDDMTPYEIGELLDHMPDDKLDAIEWYEKSHENREQVLEAVDKQRELNAAKA